MPCWSVHKAATSVHFLDCCLDADRKGQPDSDSGQGIIISPTSCQTNHMISHQKDGTVKLGRVQLNRIP